MSNIQADVRQVTHEVSLLTSEPTSYRVEFHADQLAQSVQRAPTPGRGDRFVRALVSPVCALLRACRRTGGRTWCRSGCQLHLALGAGLCTRAEQTLPTASQADQQELSDRRDLNKG